jgi:hypothetical protein
MGIRDSTGKFGAMIDRQIDSLSEIWLDWSKVYDMAPMSGIG